MNIIFSRNRILLSRASAALFFATLAVSLNGWQKDAPLVEHSLSLVGWILISVGVMGRIWSASYICGSKNVSLVANGPYSICRNPLYVSSFLGGLGVMLVTETLLLPLVFSVVFFTCYREVIAQEEGKLHAIHRVAFEAYCGRVPRFWPRFSLFSEPANYMVSAMPFRKTLSDVIWFVMAGGLIEFIEGLHVSEALPTLLHIY